MAGPNQGQTRRSVLAQRILAGLALLLVISAGLTWLASSRDDLGNTKQVEDSLSPPDTSSTTSTTEPEATSDNDIGRDVIPANGLSLLQDVAKTDGQVPVHLVIDSIGVTAPIVPAGVDSDTRLMEIPANVDEVAWYLHGPAPGEAGSAVLAAHVDLAGEGPGVFFRLGEVALGDHIIVEFEDGSDRLFIVEGRVTYPKESLPLDTVFSREGQPVLTLITCGGVFDEGARSYDSNIVVYAVPEHPGEDGVARDTTSR